MIDAQARLGRARGLATAATQLQLVVARLRDRSAIHDVVSDPAGYHAAARFAIAEVTERIEHMVDGLLADVECEPEEPGDA